MKERDLLRVNFLTKSYVDQEVRFDAVCVYVCYFRVCMA